MPKQVGNVSLMQKMNRLKVLDFIRRNPDTSRPYIAQQTGLSLASLTNVTAYLLDEGLLCECGVESADRVGRKSTLLKFCADRYGYIIVALYGSTADIYYTNLEGEKKYNETVSTEDCSSEQIIYLLREKTNLLVNRFGRENTLAVGLTFSGLVLDGNRFVLSSSMHWNEHDIKRIFEANFGLPVFVENLSIVKAVGYLFSEKRWTDKNIVFVDTENGIGTVQMVEGSVVKTVLGEIGHTTVSPDGTKCFCGNRGCLEAMCSVNSLLSTVNESGENTVSCVEEFMKLYEMGDVSAVRAVEECARYLGIGLANLVYMLNPSSLVISKGQFEGCDIVIKKAIDEMKKRVYPALLKGTEIRMAEVDEDMMVIGAAYEMCDRMFDISFPYNPVE